VSDAGATPTPPADPYAGWQVLPEEPPRSNRIRLFLWVTLGVSILLVVGYGVAYLSDPNGTDGLAVLLRLTIAILGASFIAVARGIARNESGRVKSLLTLGAEVFVAGAFDAAFLLFDASTDLPDVLRTVAFLFMGILIGTQLLLLLRRGSKDTETIAGFFAQHAPAVAFLLFLIVSRIALKEILGGFLPALFLNLAYLVAFLSTAVYLIARFLRRFGSPVSWGDAKRHEQSVERLSDPRMEDARALLKEYIGTGTKLTEYQDLMRSVMQRIDANPADIEPLLVRAPTALRPGLSSTPAGFLLGSSLAVALACGILAAGLFGRGEAPGSAFALALIVSGLLQPIVGAGLRSGDADSAPASQYGSAAALALVGAAVGYLSTSGAGPFVGLGLVAGLLYLALGVTQLLRGGNRTRRPDHAFLRAEAADTQSRRARGLMWWGLAIAAAAPAWMFFAFAAQTWIHVDGPALPLTAAGLAAGALFAGAGYLLGPLLKEHRQEIKSLHTQETGLRQSYHRTLVKKLEGART
jgi:hypothetical protein